MFSVQPSAGAQAGRWGACACVRCGPCPELFGLRRHPEVPQRVGERRRSGADTVRSGCPPAANGSALSCPARRAPFPARLRAGSWRSAGSGRGCCRGDRAMASSGRGTMDPASLAFARSYALRRRVPVHPRHAAVRKGSPRPFFQAPLAPSPVAHWAGVAPSEAQPLTDQGPGGKPGQFS